jgi:hypothetical protein
MDYVKSQLSNNKSSLIHWCLDFVQVLFSVFLFTYLMLILIETLFRGSVSSYLDLNYLLIVVITLGIASVLGAPGVSNEINLERPSKRDLFLIIFTGIGSAVVIWYKTQPIGWGSYVISIFGGGLIVCLSVLIRQGDKGREGR